MVEIDILAATSGMPGSRREVSFYEGMRFAFPTLWRCFGARGEASCDIVLARRCFGCFQKPSVVGYDVSFLTYPQERAKHDAIGDACDIFDFVP